MSSLARLPPLPAPSYPRSRLASAQSPLPAFLRLVTAVVMLVLGAGGVGAYVWTTFLYPRILRTKAATEVLESDHSARLGRVQRRLKVLLGVRAGRRQAEIEDAEDQASSENTGEEDVQEGQEEKASKPEEELNDPDNSPSSTSALAPLAAQQRAFALPESEMLDLAACLPSLAPRPRPQTLVRSLQNVSREWTSASLGFSAKTPRAGNAYGSNALSNSLERAGALGVGGAWGQPAGGAAQEGVSDVLQLIGGLRGDVKGFKAGLLSRRAFPLRRPRPAGKSNPTSATPTSESSASPSPSTSPPPRISLSTPAA